MGSPILHRCRNDRGAIIPFFVLLIPALVVLAGISYDASMLFNGRREAYNVASSAARSGATEVDQNSLYVGSPQLAGSAGPTARAFAIDHGADSAAVNTTNTKIQVTVVREIDMVFLTVIGIDSREVQATAEAEIKQGRDL